jgi:alcohol dehydrogenase class IV
MVIGLGGGSAIDAAKAVAGLMTNGGAAIDYMEVIGKGQKITKAAAPWIAVPTTAGTGAEVTKNAVIGSPEHKFKASIRGDHLLARIGLVDPELGVNVPRDVTAASGMDALCQLIESYTSQGANDLTGPLSIEGIALVSETLPRAYADGANVDAREDMAFAALLGGITLTNAGLGAVHGFAAPLGAHFPMPHGVICGVLLPHVMRANIAALRAEQSPWIFNYADVGRALAANAALPDEEAIEIGPGCVDELIKGLALPRLSKYGLQESHIAEIVALAKKTSSMRYNPVALSDEALGEVLRSAL